MATSANDSNSVREGYAGNNLSRIVEVELRSAHDGTEYADLEAYLQTVPGVTSVHLDRTRGVAHLGYDPSVTSARQLAAALTRCGYRCDCSPRQASQAQVGHPALHGEHGTAAPDHAGA